VTGERVLLFGATRGEGMFAKISRELGAVCAKSIRRVHGAAAAVMLMAAGLAPTAALAQSAGCMAVNDGVLAFTAKIVAGDPRQPETTSVATSSTYALSMIKVTAGYSDNVATTFVPGVLPFTIGDRIDFIANVTQYSSTSNGVRIRFRINNSVIGLPAGARVTPDAPGVGTYTGYYTVPSGLTGIGLSIDHPSQSSTTSITATCTPYTDVSLTLGVSMSHSGTPQQGGTVDYTITPSASGAATGSNLTLTFSLPSGLSYNSGSGSGWSCTSTRCVYSNTIANGASGNPLTLRANVAANAAASLTPSVTLSGGNAGSSANASDPTTISVTGGNGAPTDIGISPSSVNENVAGNSTVGTLSSTDPDAGDTFTYTLVAGTGSTDNAAFTISGSNLRISASPDFETKSSYSVRVRSTDAGGLFFEKAFTITVNNVNEVPSAGSVAVTGTVQVGLSLTGAYVYSDPENDAEGTSTFRWVRNSVNTGITGGSDVATTLSYTPVVGDQGQYLYFCVTPVASAGATTGVLTCSVATAQVPTSTNGACATSSVAVVSAPAGIAACIAGSVTTPAATAGQFTWGCAGNGGGTSTAAAACSVPRGYNVTPSAGANGAITPSNAQVVAYNSSTAFTVTPNSGYVANVTGTCGGNLSGATYTTNVITGACTVNAAFTPTISMANIPTRQGGVTATLSAVGCTAVGAAVFVDTPATGKPADKSFPYGLIDFTLTGCVGSADVTITYSQAIPSGATYYKELAGVYSVLPANISGNTVRFTLADNGAADADAAMGTIRDPSGLALGAGASPAAIPTLSEWGLILLAALMVGFGLLASRRRTIQRA
jgi:uncharacterized repeat protein (TIGR01451 family)